MAIWKDRRILLTAAGALVAVLAGSGIGWVIMTGHHGRTAAPPASQGGLVIDNNGQPDGKVDPAKPLRCFVAGQFVGQFTLADCARRNGVSTEALDVGVDDTGALAAADQGAAQVTPLPPPDVTPAPVNDLPPPADAQASAGSPGSCWRYAEGQWRRLPTDVPLNACVQALFAGRCEAPGGATYGRWMQQTLRLTPGRVEISSDNKSFRTLVEQGPNCSFPTS